ncbi:MAG: AAA family ATPase [Fibrobacteres bacterium]|nr:AAA family ATPase [Fibrobacterota bacterium]
MTVDQALEAKRKEAERESVATESGVGLVWACDVVPEPISWLWEGWIAAGKLHILGGRAGTGKTTLAMSLAATVSRGGSFPDGSRCGAPGRVLIWTGEDDPKDTLVPRLHAVGADLEKVAFVQTVRDAEEDRSFDPATDLPLLSEKVRQLRDVRLVIVDSIVSAVAGDSHQNGEVRRSLQPFVDIGNRFGCAVLGITHFSKGTSGGNPLERVTGSVAFGALARLVLVASKNEKAAEGESSCIFARAKSNIGKDFGGFGYDLEEVPLDAYPEIKASRVRWGASLDGTAAEILDAAEGGGSDGGHCPKRFPSCARNWPGDRWRQRKSNRERRKRGSSPGHFGEQGRPLGSNQVRQRWREFDTLGHFHQTRRGYRFGMMLTMLTTIR